MWLAVFALLNVLLVTLLAANVSRLRMRERVSYGDGDRLPLKQAIRAHGNAVEHTAIMAIAVVALELRHAPGALMATLVLAFTLVRLLHALGMLGPVMPARRVGAGATYLLEFSALVALALNLLA